METQQAIPPSEAQPAPRRVLIEFPLVEPTITYAIIAILVLVQLYITNLKLIPRDQFYIDYANIAYYVVRGEQYRLFTCMFLHANWTHLFFNGLALYMFGKDIEGFFGHVRFVIIYVLGGLLGSLASFVITQGSSVGASGAVFAVFGALVAYYYRNRPLYGASANDRLRQLAISAVVNLAIGFISNAPGSPVRIDNAAHIGGALGGFLLSWFMTPIFRIQMQMVEGQEIPQLVDIRHVKDWIYAPVVLAAVMTIVLVVVVNARAS